MAFGKGLYCSVYILPKINYIGGSGQGLLDIWASASMGRGTLVLSQDMYRASRISKIMLFGSRFTWTVRNLPIGMSTTENDM